MVAVNQAQVSGFEPAIAGDEAAEGKGRIDADALEAGAYGQLMRRAKREPLGFSFVWRGSDFRGTVESIGEGMRLSLRSDLAAIPFSAENAAARGDLLAVVDTCAGSSEAKLMVFQGRTVMLEHEIALPDSQADTMATLVTHLTILVLNTAAYLDLIAEFTASKAKVSKAEASKAEA